MSEAVDDLVGLLDLEYLDVDLFRGRQPDSDRQRVYGGQVAAQALVAAVRTVDPEFHVHSLHSYFLLPGDYEVPIIYDVERIRDGRSFVTRRVSARQHGKVIYYQTASFQRLEEGLEHQDAMPEVGGPEDGASMFDLMRERGAEDAAALGKEWAALDVRFLGNSRYGLEKDPDAPVAGTGLDPDRRQAQRRPARAPRAVHLRQRREPAGRDAGCARRRTPRTPRWPRSTTRSGSTGRSAPTSGGSTTSGRRRRTAPAASRSAGCSPRTARSWRPSPRRA